MANNDWEDFDDDDQNDGSDLVKKLRAQLKAASKRASELEAQVGDLSKKTRQTAVKEILNAKGVTPKVARFVLADVEEPTEDSVNEWLKENGELFGVEIGDQAAPSKEVTGQSAADLEALNQINQFAQSNNANGAVSSVDELADKIANAGSVEDVMKLLGKG